MKSMGWTTKDTIRSMNNEINERSLPPQNSPPKFQSKPVMACCERCSCECIKKIENTILRSNSPHKSNYRVDLDEPMQKSPRKAPPHYALPQQCNRQLEPLQPAQPMTSSKHKPRITHENFKKPSRTTMMSGGVELVPLLAKRRDDRPISLSTTDITKYKINKSR